VKRVVLLGASNVRRGLTTIARLAIGEGAEEIVGAIGHGRSYGKRSCILFRCLPGILECGVWDALARQPPDDTAAVIADVGNDILYGETPATILGWVSECLGRIQARQVSILGLPLARLRSLGPARFSLFRSIFFPTSRVPRGLTLSATEAVDAGLRRLAQRFGARFVEPSESWYGGDPIHIRRRSREEAWRRVLGTTAPSVSLSTGDALRLRLAAPERRWIAGVERRREQPAWIAPGGAVVTLY